MKHIKFKYIEENNEKTTTTIINKQVLNLIN